MPSYKELLQENSELRHRVEKQERRIAQLEKILEELRRGGKRQAGPFSKGEPKSDPQKPGRKPGKKYGQRAGRSIPEQIDETIAVDGPLACEICNGPVRAAGEERQYQIDLPEIRPQTTEFVLQVCECLQCGHRMKGRHPRQISQAVGAAGVQIGPRVISQATYLNKVGGLSYGKITAFLKQVAEFEVARSTLCRALERTASKAQPIYQELVETMRTSPVVYPDESGWLVGGFSAWLWAFTNRRVTVSSIAPGRGFAEASEILGKEYAGTLVADGWAPYRCFTQATHQTCLAHLLRRCGEMLETAQGGAARFPRRVKEILLEALAVRDRREAKKITAQGVRIAKGRLAARMDRLLSGNFTHEGNQRLAKHLRRYQKALFLFLDRDDLEATNWPAEHAIRPAVVNRKSCAGNRTRRGAETQAILMSLLRTCQQRGLNSLATFTTLLRSFKVPSYSDLLEPH